jgi:hypothetical protein
MRRDARARYFRLAHAVSLDGVALGTDAPDLLQGAVEVAFHLPGDPLPIRCRARVAATDAGDTVERRALRFIELDGDAGARIERYIEERLGLIE